MKKNVSISLIILSILVISIFLINLRYTDYNSGIKLYQKGHLDEAKTQLMKVTSQDKKYVEAQNMLSIIDQEIENARIKEEAEKESLRIKEITQLEEEVKGIPYSDYEKNYQMYKRLCELDPNNDGYLKKMNQYKTLYCKQSEEKKLYQKGYNLWYSGNSDEAISIFKIFIKKYPKSLLADDAQKMIGFAYGNLKQYTKAIEELKKVKQKYPSSNSASISLYDIAHTYFYDLNDFTKAKYYYKQFIQEATEEDAKWKSVAIDQLENWEEETKRFEEYAQRKKEQQKKKEVKPTLSEPSIGYKLCVIDGGYEKEDSVKVRRYNYLLESLAQRCSCEEINIADMSVAAQNILREEYGKEVKNITLLEAANEDLSHGCSKDDFTKYMALAIQLLK